MNFFHFLGVGYTFLFLIYNLREFFQKICKFFNFFCRFWGHFWGHFWPYFGGHFSPQKRAQKWPQKRPKNRKKFVKKSGIFFTKFLSVRNWKKICNPLPYKNKKGKNFPFLSRKSKFKFFVISIWIRSKFRWQIFLNYDFLF